ncbi:hypothetical protein WDW89_12815 [Deltaproteobacteria bacterium TL4]
MNFIKKMTSMLVIMLLSAGISFAATGGTQAASGASNKGVGIGFTFGILFQQHQKSEFKQGNGNYFRLNFAHEGEGTFFIHNEQSSFNVETGDAVTNGTQNVSGIGAQMSLTENLSLELMVGGATILLPAGASTSGGTDAVTAVRSTDSIADLGVVWDRSSGNILLNLGLNYRIHQLGQNISLTDSKGTVSTLNDKSALNIAIAVGYGF